MCDISDSEGHQTRLSLFIFSNTLVQMLACPTEEKLLRNSEKLTAFLLSKKIATVGFFYSLYLSVTCTMVKMRSTAKYGLPFQYSKQG